MEHETPEETARRLASAQREHDKIERLNGAMFPAVASLAVETLKAAALINGGSAAATLAFIGAGRQSFTESIIWGLWAFGSGVLFATFATALSYVSQYFYFISTKSYSLEWEEPFVRDTPGSQATARVAIGCHLASVIVVLTAFGCAALGLFLAARGIVIPPSR